MTEQNKMRILAFYYNYFIVLSVITSIFYWFDGATAASWLRLLLLLGVPVIILWRSKQRQREVAKEERQLPACHFEFLIIAGIVAAPGSVLNENLANFWLCCSFYGGAIVIYFFYKYLRGRYLVFYRNPSVSSETRQRAGQSMRRSLGELALIGLVVFIILLLVYQAVPEINVQKEEKTNTEQQEQDNVFDTAASRQNEMRDALSEMQEQAGENLFLVILRYMLTIAILAMVVLTLVYGMFRLILFLLRRRHRVRLDFEEVVVTSSDTEEFTRLVPVRRSAPDFPCGNDGRIRKEFYRQVRRQAGEQEISPAQTPMELRENYLGENRKEKLLTELYEKARYGKASVTEEEVRTWQKEENT